MFFPKQILIEDLIKIGVYNVAWFWFEKPFLFVSLYCLLVQKIKNGTVYQLISDDNTMKHFFMLFLKGKKTVNL